MGGGVIMNINIFLDGNTYTIIQEIAQDRGVPMEDIAIDALEEILTVDLYNITIPEACRKGTRFANRIYPLSIYIGHPLYDALREATSDTAMMLGRFAYFACWHYAQKHGHEVKEV